MLLTIQEAQLGLQIVANLELKKLARPVKGEHQVDRCSVDRLKTVIGKIDSPIACPD